MKSNQLWLIGTVVVVIALLAGTWFIGVSPQIAAAAKSSAEVKNVQTLNAAHEQTLLDLEEQVKNLKTLRTDLAALRDVIPETTLQTPFIKQISDAAIASGALIEKVTFIDPSNYVSTGATDPEVAAAIASVESNNFYVIPVEIEVSGTTDQVLGFLRNIQLTKRFYLVYEATMEQEDSDPTTDVVSITTYGQMFILTGAAAASEEAPTVVDGGVVQ